MLKLRSADPFVALHHAHAASPAAVQSAVSDGLLAACDRPPVPYGSDAMATPLFVLRGGGQPR